MTDKLKFPKPGASLEELIRFQEQILKYARETGDRGGEGRTLLGMGQTYLQLGETQTSLECVSQALRIAVETGDVSTQGHALFQMSMAGLSVGIVTDDTLNMARAALKIFQRLGDPTAELVQAFLAEHDRK
jgi:tetratricopeptide (TPR) repeat protein